MSKNGNQFDREGLVFVLKYTLGVVLLVALTGLVGSTGVFDDLGASARAHVAALRGEVSGLLDEQAEQKRAEMEESDPHLRTRVIPSPTIEESVPEKGKFIGVDLQTMKLFLYEDGERIGEHDVLSKGRPGSQWETPSGTYTVSYKNTDHFSSIGEVYMPYSMQFYGNFFIHGWPYYPDGTPVEEGFSGGCIRLSTEDAREVFEFAEIETPVFVYDSDYVGNEIAEDLFLPNFAAPHTSAESYLVADLETGEVFLEKNSNISYPIASITKLMTAVVANETIAYNNEINVTKHAVDTEGWSGALEVGDRFYLNEILYPLLLSSSNDAATAIADYRGYHNFIALMNQKARALNMDKTRFADPSGLSPHNISTVTDLFSLARYIYDRKGFLFNITTQLERTSTQEGGGERVYTNNNPFAGRDDFLGGKNGYIPEAKKTLLSLFRVPHDEEERTIIVVVLRSDDHDADSLALLHWLKNTLRSSSLSHME